MRGLYLANNVGMFSMSPGCLKMSAQNLMHFLVLPGGSLQNPGGPSIRKQHWCSSIKRVEYPRCNIRERITWNTYSAIELQLSYSSFWGKGQRLNERAWQETYIWYVANNSFCLRVRVICGETRVPSEVFIVTRHRFSTGLYR